MQSLFDFVSEYWPVVKKGSCQSLEDGETQAAQTEGHDDEGDVNLKDDGNLNGEEMAQLILGQDSAVAETVQDPEDSLGSPAVEDSYQLMAEPVLPPRDSQVPNDTYVQAESCEEQLGETHLDGSQKAIVLESQPSSPITPTVLEITPTDAPTPPPKPDKKEVEVLEVLESPAHQPTSSKDVAPTREIAIKEVQEKINALKLPSSVYQSFLGAQLHSIVICINCYPCLFTLCSGSFGGVIPTSLQEAAGCATMCSSIGFYG